MFSSAVVVAPSAVDPEEARLLEIIVRGRRATADLADEPAPDRREELEALVRAADDARRVIVQAHQGLVAKVARRYQRSGVPMADLMQEGNVGLLAALDRFDPEAGRFVGFAWYWVRQMILAAIPRNRRGFCLSSGVARQVYRVRQVRDRLEAELGREATTAEIAAASRLSTMRVTQLESVNLTHHPVNESLRSSLPDSAESGDPEHVLVKRLTLQAVHELLGKLPPRERLVIRHRYGLGVPQQRLTEIAETLGVTGSRVCQIEREALERLRRLAAGQRDQLLVA